MYVLELSIIIERCVQFTVSSVTQTSMSKVCGVQIIRWINTKYDTENSLCFDPCTHIDASAVDDDDDANKNAQNLH